MEIELQHRGAPFFPRLEFLRVTPHLINYAQNKVVLPDEGRRGRLFDKMVPLNRKSPSHTVF